jgi:hypothetical protein
MSISEQGVRPMAHHPRGRGDQLSLGQKSSLVLARVEDATWMNARGSEPQTRCTTAG